MSGNHSAHHGSHGAHAAPALLADAAAMLEGVAQRLFAEADAPPYAATLRQLPSAVKDLRLIADAAAEERLDALAQSCARLAEQAAAWTDAPGLADAVVLDLAESLDGLRRMVDELRATVDAASAGDSASAPNEAAADVATCDDATPDAASDAAVEPAAQADPSAAVADAAATNAEMSPGEVPGAHDAALEAEPEIDATNAAPEMSSETIADEMPAMDAVANEPETVEPVGAEAVTAESVDVEATAGAVVANTETASQMLTEFEAAVAVESTLGPAGAAAPAVDATTTAGEPVIDDAIVPAQSVAAASEAVEAASTDIDAAGTAGGLTDSIADFLEMDSLSGAKRAMGDLSADASVAPINAEAVTESQATESTPAALEATDENAPAGADASAPGEMLIKAARATSMAAEASATTEETSENAPQATAENMPAEPMAVDAEHGAPATSTVDDATNTVAAASLNAVSVADTPVADASEADSPEAAVPEAHAPVADAPEAPPSPDDEDVMRWLELPPGTPRWTARALELPPAQHELVESLVKDGEAAVGELDAAAERIAADRAGVAATLARISEELQRTAQFFGLGVMDGLSAMLALASQALGAAPDAVLAPLAERVRAVGRLQRVLAHEVAAGREPQWPLDPLAFAITELADGRIPGGAAPAPAAMPATPDAGPAELSGEQLAMLSSAEQQAATWGTTPLMLPPDQADLVQFLVNDVKEAAERVSGTIADLSNIAARADVSAELSRLADAMAKVTGQFEFRSLNELVTLLGDVAAGLDGVLESSLPELSIRVRAVQSLILQHATGLEVGMENTWPLDTLRRRVHRMLSGQALSPSIVGWHRGDVDRVLELDRVIEGLENPPTPEAADDQGSWSRPARKAGGASAADFVRVDMQRVDRMLETIGELVQHRGRLHQVIGELRARSAGGEAVGELVRATEAMDRSLETLQADIMGMRLVPASKLLERYPRVIRDVGRILDKDIEVRLEGAGTIIDKMMLDGLVDPLTSLLRLVASRLVEPKGVRQERGKPEQATIRLGVTHLGSQVVVHVEDDGGGFDLQDAAARLVKAGLLTPEQAAELPERELLAMLMEPDLGQTPLAQAAQAVRGVLGGQITVESTPGKGSRFELILPVRSAILPAVTVAVGRSVYGVPLRSIVEIRRLDPAERSSVLGSRCMVLREEVLPLIDAREVFGDAGEGEPSIVLVVTDGQSRAALAVDRVISKLDLAMRHIEDARLRAGPFSGTFVTQVGHVGLVVDMSRLLGAAVRARAAAGA